LFIVAVTYQLLYEQAWMVCVTLYPLAFHMSLATQYGLRFHMPSGAEVENEGFGQLADPVVIGPVDAESPGDDVELPDGAEPSDAVG
jgi:hypothetical protein